MIGRARLRLTLWYAGIFAAMLLALGGAAYWMLSQSLDDEVDRGVETVVDAWLSTAPEIDRLRPLDLEREFEGETADVFLLVFRADGALVANPSGIEAEEFVEDGLVDSAFQGMPVWATVEEHGERLRVLAAPIVDDGRVAGVVLGGRSLASRDRQLNLVLGTLGGVGLVGLAMSAAGGYLVAGRALRPIATAYERQRAFVGDASHELRSPLAVIRASSELLLREDLPPDQRDSVQEILDTSVEATDLVEDLLEIARLDRPDTRRGESVSDARDVAEGLLQHLHPLLKEHGAAVELRGLPVHLHFDEGDLRRTLRAIMENVIAHTPPGTAVTIGLQREGSEGLVVVRDTGPGVPEDRLDTLFDPFTRVDTARTPTQGHAGLGLAIAQRLARRNGARLTARNHPGGGLEITIRCRAA